MKKLPWEENFEEKSSLTLRNEQPNMPNEKYSERFNKKLDETEEGISELDYDSLEKITVSIKNRKKI